MKRSLFTPILMAAALLCQQAARADDIDVFTGATASATPNVLFIVDNTANWNTPFSNEMAALAAAFGSLPVNQDGSAMFNIGVMFATESGNGNSNTSGAYVRAAIRPMNTVSRALYATMINNFDKLADKGDGGRSGLTMAEAWLYFSGSAPYAGNGKVKTDYLGNICVACGMKPAEMAADDAVWALPGNALASEFATSYNPPPNSSGCTKTFIIYISNGPNQENSSADATANSMLAAVGGDTTTIPVSPAGSMSNPSDEWARFMHHSNLGVVTYTIDVNPPSNGQGPGWSALLKSMASVGGGKYQAVPAGSGGTADTSSISQAILADLSEIQAVNSVYAAVSLPASASAQGTYLNQVYIGMFRPDPSAAPRWYGNLKQYQMGFIGTALKVEDADQKSAINNQTGFITECARSFWSPTSVDSYWTFFPEGVCIPPSGLAANAYQISNYPDGNIVEKGGEGYLLRQGSPNSRTMYTSPTGMGSGSTTLTSFNTSNAALTNAALNVQAPDLLSDVINWERGVDVKDENLNGITNEMRPSVHGDVVHSRPVAINYGTASTPNVVVFYGANDGGLRAVNGNQSTNAYGAVPGGELWSFVPPEFYPAITRLYDNSPLISFPSMPATGLNPPPQPKSYGVDGPMTAYHPASNSTWLYAPMRRGGRVLYSFDVSNPASPTIKWKPAANNFTPPGRYDTGCSLTGMGQAGPRPR
jgi:type IV pilus assembly protein PilY1